MSEVKVITNNKPREMFYLYELSEDIQEHLRKEFDWIDDSSICTWDEEQFIQYKGEWYCLSDFTSIHNRVYTPSYPEFMCGWDGYLNDTFFSGILIKFTDEDDTCIMGTFYS